MNINNARYRADERPVEEGCDCPTCQSCSRAFLRHLFRSGEPPYYRLATLHKPAVHTRLMDRVRARLAQGVFPALLDLAGR